MPRLVLASILVLAAANVRGDEPPPQPGRVLARARVLAGRGETRAAIDLLRPHATAAAPLVLAELCWLEVVAADASSTEVCRRALAAAPDDRARAAVLYSLGRSLEPSHPDEALAQYDRSLALRPSAAVERRRAALRELGGCERTRPAGPAPDVPALCAAFRRQNPDLEGEECGLRLPEEAHATTARVTGTGDIREVALLSAQNGWPNHGESNEILLGVRTARGWFAPVSLGNAFWGATGTGTDDPCDSSDVLTVRSLALVDLVPGGAPEIRIDTTMASSGGCTSDTRSEGTRTEGTTLCQLRGETPVCVSFTTAEVGTLTRAGGTERETTHFRLRVRFDPDGTVVVEPAQGTPPPVLGRWLGRHRLQDRFVAAAACFE